MNIGTPQREDDNLCFSIHSEFRSKRERTKIQTNIYFILESDKEFSNVSKDHKLTPSAKLKLRYYHPQGP